MVTAACHKILHVYNRLTLAMLYIVRNEISIFVHIISINQSVHENELIACMHCKEIDAYEIKR